MAGLDALGTMLERSDMGAVPVFMPIANVSNFGGPEFERETYDVTAHDSPDGWREYIGGLKDGGELSVEVNYDPAEHDVLIADLNDATARDYRMTWPTGAAWEFGAFLTGFSPEAPVDDKLAAELTFQVTGQPTLTPAPVGP